MYNIYKNLGWSCDHLRLAVEPPVPHLALITIKEKLTLFKHTAETLDLGILNNHAHKLMASSPTDPNRCLASSKDHQHHHCRNLKRHLDGEG